MTLTGAEGIDPARSSTNSLYNVALVTIAILAGVAAIWTGASYGFERGGALGGIIGVASALGCLLGPKLFSDALRCRDIGRSIAAAALLVVCVAFAVSGALGAAASARDVSVTPSRLVDGAPVGS